MNEFQLGNNRKGTLFSLLHKYLYIYIYIILEKLIATNNTFSKNSQEKTTICDN